MKAVVAAFNQEKAFSVIVQLHRLIVYSTSHQSPVVIVRQLQISNHLEPFRAVTSLKQATAAASQLEILLYGAANGFLTSSKLDNMNSETYDTIYLSVSTMYSV